MATRTPLYDWHVAHGARMVDFAGWDMPVQYTSITDEHQAVRTAAGWFDISHMGRLVFEGPGALGLIQLIYTNDAASMKPGQARYGLVCNQRGGILDDVLVYRLDRFWLMVVNASNREKILQWIEQHRDRYDVTVTDRTADMAMVAVQGPRAVDLVNAEFSGARNLRYYHAQVMGSSAAWIVSRTGYTGEDGFEIMVPPVHGLATELVNRMLPHRVEQVGVPMRPCGLGARDTLRLEAGMPLYGHELSEDIDPFQAGLGWAVKMEKGDFIGREALARRRQEPARRRVGLELEGKRIARDGAAVTRAGGEIGRVTSGTFAPTLAKAIAMAYVDADASGAGTSCEVDVRGKPVPARVVPLPFYRRTKT
ncbi:MAG TPA: glycine cleavage system aminomethyltransferase GcvT [Gemmataceae bacterium]|nr:glycine cleavage system aminomethyltransferase GcvT [Gemmataceae bacterium]